MSNTTYMIDPGVPVGQETSAPVAQRRAVMFRSAGWQTVFYAPREGMTRAEWAEHVAGMFAAGWRVWSPESRDVFASVEDFQRQAHRTGCVRIRRDRGWGSGGHSFEIAPPETSVFCAFQRSAPLPGGIILW